MVNRVEDPRPNAAAPEWQRIASIRKISVARYHWKSWLIHRLEKMLGTFAPNKEPYVHTFKEEATPFGLLARGIYAPKLKVRENEKCTVHRSKIGDIFYFIWEEELVATDQLTLNFISTLEHALKVYQNWSYCEEQPLEVGLHSAQTFNEDSMSNRRKTSHCNQLNPTKLLPLLKTLSKLSAQYDPILFGNLGLDNK
ncbi:unnamed protein product [Malus baccata var. baccata]